MATTSKSRSNSPASSDSEGPTAAVGPASSSSASITMAERKAKMEQLRSKLRHSARANREDLVAESSAQKTSAREQARLERQRKMAETLREKADAEDRGEDLERRKNWEYTIEENEAWEKRLEQKAHRADFQFNDHADAAQRRYEKDLDLIKPDLDAYNAQKAAAFGLGPSSSSTALARRGVTAEVQGQIVLSAQEQQLARESLYRDANTLIYGDNKPSEDAIDRVVGKLNQDLDKRSKFSRKRANEDEGDITYINERNRVFNKKISRYYDKYTTEIRASFERGTAL